MYNFAILDPRSIPAATEANENIFASGNVYGIEVTVPALAEKCVANIDPQHTEGNVGLAAIEVALTAELPPDGATLATVRADLDSIGAMAIFVIRTAVDQPEFTAGCVTPAQVRIDAIATADKFARGEWQYRSLPTRDNPWPEETASAESSQSLAAMAAAVADFKVPLAIRVDRMVDWLLYGKEPEQYRTQVEKERRDLIDALESREIDYSLNVTAWCVVCQSDYTPIYPTPAMCPNCYGGDTREINRVAVVKTTHRAATMVGYSLAPVVVALNPEFRFQGGEAHAKHTICQYQAGYVDLVAVKDDLAAIEPGWGGSPTIIGSPQGISSKLTIDEVVAVVLRHLK